MSIAENIQHVQARIAETCHRISRNPEEVKIVAVTKFVPVERMIEAIDAGIATVGENRVQEAWQKYQSLDRPVHWHMIGHLQSNKVKRALQFAEMIQSVDSIHLAEEIQRQAEKQERTVDVLVQVNTSGEASKFGFSPEEALDAVGRIVELQNLRVQGLMTIGAFSTDAAVVRPCFEQLRELRGRINAFLESVDKLRELSMGMTNDFELAIEEGATIVRIGRSIFGERMPK